MRIKGKEGERREAEKRRLTFRRSATKMKGGEAFMWVAATPHL